MRVAFDLTDGERMSPLWAKLYDHFIEELEYARLMLENPKPPEVEPHDVTRGRIKALRSLISLNERKPDVE